MTPAGIQRVARKYLTGGRVQVVAVGERATLEAALKDLEAAIKRRSKWRGRWVFYQVLEAELAPILAVSADPAMMRARVWTMLERYGHAPEAPPLRAGGRAGDAAPLCRPSPHSRSSGGE